MLVRTDPLEFYDTNGSLSEVLWAVKTGTLAKAVLVHHHLDTQTCGIFFNFWRLQARILRVNH